jgi:hypothetical protein
MINEVNFRNRENETNKLTGDINIAIVYMLFAA